MTSAYDPGTPCWYELMTPGLSASGEFYSGILGWTVADSGMQGTTYHLAGIGETMVAGMMEPSAPGMPCAWMIYIAVASADDTARAAEAAGGKVFKAPQDIPGVGRFAILADPDGAAFGILQPLPGGQGGAFDQNRTGHGNWHELRSADPEAALAFYGTLFGWRESRRMEMGAMGFYHLFRHGGADIGGMMRTPPGTPPHWLPYFSVESVGAAVGRIGSTGGTVVQGPDEVPGGPFIARATDPQGIAFAILGPK